MGGAIKYPKPTAKQPSLIARWLGKEMPPLKIKRLTKTRSDDFLIDMHARDESKNHFKLRKIRRKLALHASFVATIHQKPVTLGLYYTHRIAPLKVCKTK